jgi:hypothetical protein
VADSPPDGKIILYPLFDGKLARDTMVFRVLGRWRRGSVIGKESQLLRVFYTLCAHVFKDPANGGRVVVGKRHVRFNG